MEFVKVWNAKMHNSKSIILIYQTSLHHQILMSALQQTFVVQTNNVPILQAHTHVPVTLVTGREEMELVKVYARTLKCDKLVNFVYQIICRC